MRCTVRSILAGCFGIAVIFMCGCGQEPDLKILCGNSFSDPVKELVRRFEEKTGKEVEISFGGSETLWPSVELKATGDVFVTHDPFTDDTKEAGVLLRRIDVGLMGPVLVVRKGNPTGITGLDDLAKPGVRVVLPDPKHSTCGEMVVKMLEDKQIKDAVDENVEDHLVRNHDDVGNQLKLDVRDAGIMWNGVAAKFADDIEIIPTDYAYDEIHVAMMGLSYSKNQETLKQFLEFLDEEGEEVFREFGYVMETASE